MNRIANQIAAYLANGISAFDSEDFLEHYGVLHRSGRYPWGSGKEPFQHSKDFKARVDELRAQNITYTDENGKVWKGDAAVAKTMGMTTSDLRTQISLAETERWMEKNARAKALKEDHLTVTQIGREMGINESSVRSLLDPGAEKRRMLVVNTADYLREQVDKKGMVDVGSGVEVKLGVSREKMKQALYILQQEGYEVYGGGVPQPTNSGQQTNQKVLCVPGTQHSDIFDYSKVGTVTDYTSDDDGNTFRKSFVYPASMDSSRLSICYAEQGGKEKDGLVEIRRGVKDLSLGESTYAQVRILVDGTHYIKGMAVYADDLPDGVDVRFNTNKSEGTPACGEKGNTVLKLIGKDPDNPFGSLIKEQGGQSYYDDPNGDYTDPVTGKKQSLSLINKRAEEGDWGDWSKSLPSQFLSKQSEQLIKRQLTLAKADKTEEFAEICALTNPTVKKKLLSSFAEDCDAAAVHLKAAALPRQTYKVIIPITSMKDNEVYAPSYKDGEKVALIRYPHGGTFEIPILTVNNKQKDAKATLGSTPADAIGINSKVAERLSGADFDGDTVMVIPTGGKVNIVSTDPLDGLKDFDPKLQYPEVEGMKIMKNTQKEMGAVSNLITDMTLKGATDLEVEKAVRHSMVVIDAEKHRLNYQQSYLDNDIAALKKKYQGHIGADGRYSEGAATLISRAKSEVSVPKRQGSAQIDKETGEVTYKLNPNRFYTYEKTNKKTGEVTIVEKERTQKSTAMAETKDARTLSSGTWQEELYADYANSLKALANDARKEMVTTGNIQYSAAANKTYAAEVSELQSKLNVALLNSPKERQAIRVANVKIEAKKEAAKANGEELTKKELKKISQQELTKAREQVGAKRETISITDREWEAIQAGAISETQLSKILDNTDLDKIRERATPKTSTSPSAVKISKMKAMQASGYTLAEIAEATGFSSSTVSKYLKGKG